MGFKQTIRRMAGSGLAALTAIGLLGTALVAAPAATAATTSYDIGKVGSVKFTDLLANNKQGLSLNSNSHVYPADGLGWKHFQATAQLDTHINNIGSLHAGDTVTIPLSKTGRFGWDTTSVLPNVRNGVGDIIFTASVSDSTIILTRTTASAVGAFDYRLQPSINGWYAYPASIGNKTTLTAGGSSYTLTSTLPTENYKLGNDAMHVYANLTSYPDGNVMGARLLGGASHDAIANGKTPTTSKEDWIFHVHMAGDNGHKITLKEVKLTAFSYTAYDATHAGFSYDGDVTGGIDTVAKEGSTANKGGWTKTINADGSIDLYINLGALWGDRAVRYNAGAKSYDATTNQYLKNNGNLPDDVDGSILIGFDSNTEKRTATYTTEVTNAGRTVKLESGTASNTPISNTIGNGESAIEYVGNGATGGKYLNNTAKPGTTTTTASASQFTRTGYTFTGWNTKADGTGTAYNAGAAITYPAEGTTLTLYAQWKVSSHTVTFDANGGSTVASQTVDDKAKAKEPTSTRSGWTLDGWYLDGVKYDFNTPVTRDITLKAGWRKTDVTTAKADLHKRLATGSKNGQYKLTLDVKGTGSPAMRNTTVTDPLSKWVDPAGLADGKGTGITVTKDGKAMTSGYTATYDAKTRTVKVVLPGDLADGATYAVSFEVVLSNAARQAYMQSGAYPDTGDADTGLNAGKKGYFTNGNATLTWDAVTTVNGAPNIVPSKAAYPKPVVTWASDAPSVLVNHLPGTGGTASLIPVIAGMGIAIAIASAWAIRRRLA